TVPVKKEDKKKIVTAKSITSKKEALSKKVKTSAASVPTNLKSASPLRQSLPIVGIGSSAGGLEAAEAFFSAMPSETGCAFVLVPHLAPTHVSIMPELIQKQTTMKVVQITDGISVQPDSVYVVPPNRDLSILNGTLQLMEPDHPRGAHLPIDRFFTSLALDQGTNAVCIILSGTGRDGTLGAKAIKAESGMVMVQDETSAKYDGMPRSAIATGIADYVLPPSEMPRQLLKFLRHAVRSSTPMIINDEDNMPNHLQQICIILRSRTGHDFSLYKKNTLLRRIERRMHVHQIDKVNEYVLFLQKSEVETDTLFKELLIGVTSFFRDTSAFEALGEKFLPDLLKDKPNNYVMRVWVAGCSSGEEAYSLAILLQEVLERLNRRINIQIFGTDIDAEAVSSARAGIFPASIAADVGETRLQRWFIKEDAHYRIKKSIREMLVFAEQSIIKDPPFTKLDLLSCRNMLIYFGPELQKRLMPIFQYCLKPAGILFLGSSESIGQSHDFFTVLDKKWKLYSRRPVSFVARRVLEMPPMPLTKPRPHLQQPDAVRKAEEMSAFQLVETILKQVKAPPCVIIDEACDIIYLHGHIGRYLEPASGKVSINILDMSRPGLKPGLASAIRESAANMQECVRKDIAIEHDIGLINLDLTVKPILEHSALHGLTMVIFNEVDSNAATKKRNRKAPKPQAKNSAVEMIEQELRYTRENLQTTIEELETSNEELKSTNEELQSTNEELQSTNEELETSKEELQSLNEEATTVNAELQSHIDELSKANDDMKNLLDRTQLATIFLDLDLCVRRFTPKAVEIIPLTSIDYGRPIKHFATALIDTDLAADASSILQDLGMKEQEVRSENGDCFRMRTRPYRTMNNVIDGVVITFENITELKNTQEALNKVNAKLEKRNKSLNATK
nr:PAS domain-containing protein [Desulfobulbaceae bacterium]